MAFTSFTSSIPDAPELAASICATAPLRTLVHDDDFRLYRFSGAYGRYEVEKLSYHALSLQHARGSRVRAQVGEDRFCGIWERDAFDLRPASAPRRITWTEPVDLTSIWLAPAFCARVLENPDFDVAPFFAMRHPRICEILALLSRGADMGGPYGRLYREGLVISLIAALGTWNGAQRGTPTRCGLSPARLRKVLDFIEHHVVDDIPLAALAAQACVSERHSARCSGSPWVDLRIGT